MLVEGESDCHTLWHHGYHAVDLPGAAAFKDEWLGYFAGFDVVYVVIEPDRGGEQLLKCIAKQPSWFKALVRLVTPTHFKDPSELHLDSEEHFEARFDVTLEGAEPWGGYAARVAWVRELEQEQEAPKKERAAISRLSSDVEPEEVDWLWVNRIARGKLQVILGNADLGKTTVALDFAA